MRESKGEGMGLDRNPYRWIVYSAAFMNFMSKLDGVIVNISLPSIAQDLKVGTAAVSWVAMSYLLGMAATLPLFGKMADRIGAKRIFVAGLSVFLLGSLLSGLSTTIGSLIAARCVQALGASMGASASLATVAGYLPQGLQGWAFGIQTTAAALGIGIGAPLGGLITGLISWHWVFLINVPVGLVAILVAQRAIPGDAPSPERARGGFDVIGSALALVSAFGLLFALSMGGELGWTSRRILWLAGLSGAALLTFIAWERRASDPVVDLSLLKNCDISRGMLACALACVFLGGNGFIIPYYLRLSRGLPAEKAGLVVWIYSVVYVLVAAHFGRLADRVDAPRISAAGCGAGALATALFAWALGLPGIWTACAYMVLLAVCMAAVISPSLKWVMRSAPQESKGIVSGLYTMAFTFGMTLGVGLFETLFSGGLRALKEGGDAGAAAVPVAVLNLGFERAYWTGAAILGAGCLISVVAAWFKPKGPGPAALPA